MLQAAIDESGFGRFQLKMMLLTSFSYFAVCSELLLFIFIGAEISEWVTPMTFSWLPFATTVTSICSSVFWGYIADNFGRQKPFMFSIFIAALFGALSSTSQSFAVLVFYRALTAIGISGIVAIDFVLMMEFSPTKHRGRTIVVLVFAGACGVLMLSLFAFMGWAANWRSLALIATLPLGSTFILRLLVSTESPHFLISVGREQEAFEIIEEICHSNNNKAGDGLRRVKEVIAQLKSDAKKDTAVAQKQKQKQQKASVFDLLRPKYRRTTLLLWMIRICQSTAYWGVTIFLPAYLKRVSVNAYQGIFFMVAAELPGLLICAFMLDRFGRLMSLRLFTFLASSALFAFAFCPLLLTASAVYMFMIPNFAILYSYTPELYATEVRATAVAAANVVAALPALVTSFGASALLGSSVEWLFPVVWGTVVLVEFCCALALRRETHLELLETHVRGPVSNPKHAEP